MVRPPWLLSLVPSLAISVAVWKIPRTGGDASPLALDSRLDPDGVRTMTEAESSLGSLLGGYFHQDWDIEGPNAEAVIRRFASENLREDVVTAKDEAQALLAAGLGEHELAATVKALGQDYLPEADGMSYRRWLEFIVEALEAELEDSI